MASLRKGQIMVQLYYDFKVERGGVFGSRYLHHLINGLWCDKENNFSRRRNYGSMVREVMSLTFEGKFRIMIDLGKEIQRKI